MWNFYIWIDYNKNHVYFPRLWKQKKRWNHLLIFYIRWFPVWLWYTPETRNQRCRLKISVHSFPCLTVRIPWNQCDQKLNENCTALITIKVSAQIWLASVNSWRRSSSFTKCNMRQMDSDQRKQKSTVMNLPPPKKELYHVEWVWTKIYSKTVCSLTRICPKYSHLQSSCKISLKSNNFTQVITETRKCDWQMDEALCYTLLSLKSAFKDRQSF